MKIIAKINGWGPPCRFDTTTTSMLATWLIADLQHINLQNLVEVWWAVAASSSVKWPMGWNIIVVYHMFLSDTSYTVGTKWLMHVP